tara:strand:- start:1040 stop:2203 length:1164 start_codon:yes stop_codon:yes gene_type:complete
MSKNRDFLKEAIADAKAVKESAIANAKAALEESFTPRLKSMLAQKIEELDTVKEEEDVEEAKKYGEDEINEKLSNPVMRKGLKGDNKAELETEKMRELDEMSLDEILSELEGEIKEDARTDAEEEGYLDGMKDEKEDLKEDERTDAEEEGYKDGEKDEKEDLEGEVDDEEIDLENLTDDDLKDFISDVIGDMVAAGELEAGGDPVEIVGDEEEVSIDVEDVEVEDEVETDVEVTAENKRTDAEEEGYKDGLKDGKADAVKAIKKIKLQEKDLKEAYNTIKALKSQLNEINLLNAKLLYSNKIFKSKSLTEAQKVKVLASFDKATTVKETKLVYETLSEGLKSKRRPVTENVIGRASKATKATVKRTKKPIVESNEMVNRFKKLAGII